jgi:hypothetical protein
MDLLPSDEVLFFPGSLISAAGEFVAPYDLEDETGELTGYGASTCDHRVKHANSAPFRVDWTTVSAAHIVNGMGVTLGDSLIGLTAIAAIKAKFPHVRFHIYRPARAPGYVQELYSLASGIVIDQCLTLPHRLTHLPANEIIIDVGNHLFWPRFSDTPMIDFFLDALGVDAIHVDAVHKQNRWLQALPRCGLPSPPRQHPFALFCPSASTPLRSIPERFHTDLVEAVSRKYGFPIFGFGRVDHPSYREITLHGLTTRSFIEWLRGASFVMAGDSAAVHVAAGYGIPTTAFFSSIEPELRVRDYEHCFPIILDVPSLRSVQASNRSGDLKIVDDAFVAILQSGLRLPDLDA